MELSEEELRLLEQMERALVEEDPKLASTLRGTSFQRAARRRMILGGVILVAGIGLLIVAVLLDVNAVVQTDRRCPRLRRDARRRDPRADLRPRTRRPGAQGACLRPHRLRRRRRRSSAPPQPPAVGQPLHGAHGGAVASPPRARLLTPPADRALCPSPPGASTGHCVGCGVVRAARRDEPRAGARSLACRTTCPLAARAGQPTSSSTVRLVSGSTGVSGAGRRDARAGRHDVRRPTTEAGHQAARRTSRGVTPAASGCLDELGLARANRSAVKVSGSRA